MTAVETSSQYDKAIAGCKDIFLKKMKDYGSAWRILRLPSIADQVYIKAQRIRSIQEKGKQEIDENISDEFRGILNYAVMAIIQHEIGVAEEPDMDSKVAEKNFEKVVGKAKSLMEKKNHDYGEAWREMRMESFTDLILMKLLRIRQIEGNDGKTIISEGVVSNYYDIINYSVFALIKSGTK
jgi:5-methylthioribose kinase